MIGVGGCEWVFGSPGFILGSKWDGTRAARADLGNARGNTPGGPRNWAVLSNHGVEKTALFVFSLELCCITVSLKQS